MPLVIVSGYPSSGKSFRASQLHDYFARKIASSEDAKVKRLNLCLIDDQSLGLSRQAYAAARSEKDARAAFASAIKRTLSRDTIVIADGMNYIKGFRYQLYCEAKAVQTPSCVLHVGTPHAQCKLFNDAAQANGTGGYDPDLFENLVFRYEEPNGMNRWDAPLFTLPHDDPEPPYDALWSTLVGADGKLRVVKPNAATVLKPASAQDYLYDLDKTTSDVVTSLVEWQSLHPAESGAEVNISGASNVVLLPTVVPTQPQLQRLRRQFITLNRQHTLDKARIRDLFIDYLNDQFQT